MDITGVLSGDLAKCAITSNDEKDGGTMICDVDVVLTKEQTEQFFETELVELCFASMHKAVDHNEDGDETVCRFGYQTLKPPKWLVGSVHKADLWGTKAELQPIVRLITAGDKVPVVSIGLRFEVPVSGNADLIGALGCKTGKTVKVKLAPKNPKLALKTRKSA